MVRFSIFAALVALACGAWACDSDSKNAPVASGVDAGEEAGSSSGDPDGDGDFGEQPLAECIAPSIGVWDDFEALPDGRDARFLPPETTALTLDGQFHCGAQSLKASITHEPAVFVRNVPRVETPVAVSWSFLVQFETTAIKNRFAQLELDGSHGLVFEIDQGNLALVETHLLVNLDAGVAETVHASLGTIAPNVWTRIDVRIDYPTKVATLKLGPPGGTGPTQPTREVTLAMPLGSVSTEKLGPQPLVTGLPVTVRYDRAAVFVE